MERWTRTLKTAGVVLVLALGAAVERVEANNLQIAGWWVIGPLSTPRGADEPLQEYRAKQWAFDFLAPAGGAAQLRMTAGKAVPVAVEGEFIPQWFEVGSSGGLVLDGKLSPTDEQTAYAYTTVESPSVQTAHALFGSDDSAVVWVNGAQVHKTPFIGRGMRIGDDTFAVKLNAGTNHILVRVHNWGGGWGLGLKLLDEEAYAAHQERERRIALERAFQAVEIKPTFPPRYVLMPGMRATLDWSQPYLVKALHGEIPLEARWFDRDHNEVDRPTKPGRYGVYLTGTTPDGFELRRAVTLYVANREFQPWIRPLEGGMPFDGSLGFDKQVWEWYSAGGSAWGNFVTAELLRSEGGARLLAALDDWSKADHVPANRPVHQLDEPDVLDMDYHLALKRKVLDLGPAKGLADPRRLISDPAPVVREGTAEEAGVDPALSSELAVLCEEWAEKSKAPFVLCVVRNGVIVHHEGYGTYGGEKVTTDTRLGLASITKALSGIMLAQFLDQGLITLDESLGKHLPDIPAEGEHAITWRQCFTHATGFSGHVRFGGMLNPWLDNVLMSAPTTVRPGKHFEYNGMGYDLAGHGMAMIAGKSYFRLVHENLYGPLGITDLHQRDLGTGTRMRAGDLAKLGQLLLNGGRYGNLEFFTPETRAKLLPTDIKQFYPELENAPDSWGIGLTWMPWPSQSDAQLPADQCQTVGHGSAWSSIFRIDMARQIVVTMVRRETGQHFGDYHDRLLRTIEAGLR